VGLSSTTKSVFWGGKENMSKENLGCAGLVVKFGRVEFEGKNGSSSRDLSFFKE
jgi:hypothetical protein